MKKITKHKVIVSNTFPLTTFLYLTNNDFQDNEKLISFLQEHNLNFKRLKGKEYEFFNTEFPFFYKNANFVVWSTQRVSQDVFFLLMQFLISKIRVLVCFYKGQVWTFSRLKQIQKMLFKSMAQSKRDSSAINILWKCFQNQNF